MTKQAFASVPDVAVSETSGSSAMVAFAVLAICLFAGLAFAHYWRRKREKDGIYTKYKLPGDPRKAPRSSSNASR